MEISYNWLSSYLPEPIALEEVSKILTSIGLEVEHIEKSEAIKGSLEGLVIGEVLTCVPHPNADKLRITTVNIGNDTILPIVCGAPNVAAGQKVIVATVGTTVHPTSGESFEIKKAKIRGEVSEGMICADDEIGLGTSHDGIKVLPNDVIVGTLANQYFDIPPCDYTISIGLTPNRSDGNSHIGAARDICAYQTHHTGKTWNLVYPELKTIPTTAQLPIEIKIEANESCPRYAGITIANVKVAPSPEWLQLRLKAIGQRPINNIVDITNFVLHEYGQPLHAFDYDKVAQKTIIVKHLPEATKFITLDEKERSLRAEDLMICDAEKPLTIAGVFGGAEAGITDDTTNVFLESAYFYPKTIRRTSLHHGLRTDAATHFEKSVDIEMVIPALKRAVALIQEIADGAVASEITDIYPQVLEKRSIAIRYEYINALCGKNYTAESIKTILTALGFVITTEDTETLTLLVPSDKVDVFQPADIVEEVLRIDGLDNIAIPTTLNISINERKAPVTRKWKERIATHLTGLGLQEIVTNSITNSKYYPNQDNLVTMLNSLTTELDVMRPEMLESGLEVLNYNINRKQQDLKLYEIGNVYFKDEKGNYKQTSKAAIWITGLESAASWQAKSKKTDIFYAKGLIESIFKICGITKFQYEFEQNTIVWKRGKDILAKVEAVAPTKLKTFDIKQEVFYAEIDIQNLVDAAQSTVVKYKALPKFPAVKRDLAVVVNKTVTFQDIINVLNKQKFATLKSYDLFDVFESEKIGNDNKSLALSFTFLDAEKTLTDQEIDAMMQQLIKAYEKDLNAIIRA